MTDDPPGADIALLEGRHCVVALSGGADSAVAARLARDHADAARAVHVHHVLPASDLRAAAAQAVAEALGLGLDVVRVTVDGSSETAARDARRPALVASLRPGEVLVTGHTLDDQAETVVHRLIRGSGPEGLAGMAVDDGTVLRPLLGVDRAAVRAAAAAMPFVDDPENADPRHVRTRIRTVVMPALVSENPAAAAAIARLARHLRALPADPAPAVLGDGVARVPRPVLAVAGPARAAATIRAALVSARPPHPPSTDEVDRCLAVARGDVRRAELEGGLVVLRDRTWLRIGALPTAPESIPLVDLPARWGGFEFVTGGSGTSVASARVPTGSRVRGATTTDRIAISTGSKLVGNALGEVGIPAELRPTWPVVEGPDGAITWVPLVRRAHGSDPGRGGYLGVDAWTEDAW